MDSKRKTIPGKRAAMDKRAVIFATLGLTLGACSSVPVEDGLSLGGNTCIDVPGTDDPTDAHRAGSLTVRARVYADGVPVPCGAWITQDGDDYLDLYVEHGARLTGWSCEADGITADTYEFLYPPSGQTRVGFLYRRGEFQDYCFNIGWAGAATLNLALEGSSDQARPPNIPPVDDVGGES